MAEPEYIEIKMEPADYVELVDEGENCFSWEVDIPNNSDEPVVHTHRCDSCDITFLTRKRLCIHLKKSHPKIAADLHLFKCNQCDLSCDDAESLEEHIITEHTVKKEFKIKQELKIESIFFDENGETCFDSEMSANDNLNSSIDIIKSPYESDNDDSNEPLAEKFEMEIQIENVTLIKNKKSGKFFICKECNCPFKDKRHLKIHMARKHKHNIEKYKFKCQHCSLSYDKKNSLRAHEIRVHKKINENLFVCKPCGEEFDKFEDFEKHETGEKHINMMSKLKPFYDIDGNDTSDAKSLNCDVCDEKFKNKMSLKAHKRKIHERIVEKLFSCDFCPMTYSKKDSLAKHILRKHCAEVPSKSNKKKKKKNEKVEEFNCTHCDKEYNNFDSLRAHIRRKHSPFAENSSGEKTCSQCSEVFDNENKLRAHRRIAHANANLHFKCNTCSTPFASDESLQKHVQKKHTNVAYKCRKCRSRFINQELLNEHKMAPCSIKCVFCVKRFTSMHYVMKHQRAKHPSVFRFFCEFCGLAYHFEDALKKHIRYGHRDKTHQCQQCEKAFKTKGELNKHIEKHKLESQNCTTDNHDSTIDNHDPTIDNHDSTIDNHDSTIDNQDSTIEEHDSTIDKGVMHHSCMMDIDDGPIDVTM